MVYVITVSISVRVKVWVFVIGCCVWGVRNLKCEESEV